MRWKSVWPSILREGLQVYKALAKVSCNFQGSRIRPFGKDPTDLRGILLEAAPAQYGSKGKQRLQKSYSQPLKQNQKLFSRARRSRTTKYYPCQ